jgi:hypothetical protein
VLHNSCRRNKIAKSITQARQSMLQPLFAVPVPVPVPVPFPCPPSEQPQPRLDSPNHTRQCNSVLVASTLGLACLYLSYHFIRDAQCISRWRTPAYVWTCVLSIGPLYSPTSPLQRLTQSLNQDPRLASAFSSFCSMALMNVVYGVRVPRARLMCALTICRP